MVDRLVYWVSVTVDRELAVTVCVKCAVCIAVCMPSLVCLVTARGSGSSIVFGIVTKFFPFVLYANAITHEPLHLAS